MSVIRLRTLIQAPVERCFDVARNIDLHVQSTTGTDEEAIPAGGRTSGLLGPGEWVTWRARHFGLTQLMTMRMAEFDPPFRFVDEMVRGPFHRIRHTHEFRRADGATLMEDLFEYEPPLGPLGVLVDFLVLRRHMCRLLTHRADFLRIAAESQSGGEDLKCAS